MSGATGNTLGLYPLYAKPCGVAEVLRVLSLKNRESLVLGALMRHARDLGAVAVRGAVNPQAVEGLIRQPGIVHHHVAATVAFTRRPDPRAALASNDTLLGGLLGESWTRLMGDDFA